MLAILAFLAGFLALILKITGSHGSWLQWLLIVGLMLVSAAVIAYIRGWHDPIVRTRS
jgi:hypothetical protein